MISIRQIILLAILLGGCVRTQVPNHTIRVPGWAGGLTIAFGSTSDILRVALDNHGKDFVVYEGTNMPLVLDVGPDGGCNGVETPYGFVDMISRYVDRDTGKTNTYMAIASLDGKTNELISIWQSVGNSILVSG